MLKPLTLSVSLAVALGVCGVSKAGHLTKGSSLCGLASPQCAPSPQYRPAPPCKPTPQCKPSAQCAPSAQCNVCSKKSCLSGLFQHRPRAYYYEWVLKKRRCGGLLGHGGGCDICGGPVLASGQVASGQAVATGQVFGAGQAAPPPTMAAPVGEEVPPPPPPPAPEGAVPPPPPPPSTPPAANAPQGSLLFLAPAGN
jgi:hypothetical protein